MSAEQNKVVVDGITYEFEQISPRILKPKGIKFFRMLAPVLCIVFDLNEDDTEYSIAVKNAISGLNENEYMEFENLLFSETFHRGGTYKGNLIEACGHLTVNENYDKAFDRKMLHSFNVLFAAFKYYYNDFFADGVSLVSRMKNLAGSLQGEK